MNIPELNKNYIQTQYNQSTSHTIAKVNHSDKTADSAGLIKEDSAVTKKNEIYHLAKEVAISSIPIYGTIQAFKKGEIGWGIFGIVTDALLIVPAIGVGAKLAVNFIARRSKIASTTMRSTATIATASSFKILHEAARPKNVANTVDTVKNDVIINKMIPTNATK
ncbi:hypothetical protein [Candidatus Liberibacter solanacearum]|uniref:hypothetical protein n=1 Tax=Candidatus Liberibacter solanacearum TaxID=556287 RepID=UPI0002FBE8C9|nr:hypothetical protein [Candidatus Liberibacter solanacearum]